MSQRAAHKVRAGAPIDLAKERADRSPETAQGWDLRRWLDDFVASVAARWRRHEPEIAILGTITLILAIVAASSGADLLFTLMLTIVAAVTIWSPWRKPR